MIAQFIVLFVAVVCFLLLGGAADLNRMKGETSRSSQSGV